jgi:hypothetical protein
VPITTKVVSLNVAQAIKHCVIKFVSDLWPGPVEVIVVLVFSHFKNPAQYVGLVESRYHHYLVNSYKNSLITHSVIMV